MTYKDSQGHIYRGGSMTRLVDGVLFSGVPTVEQLTAWGYEEVIEPEPTPEELLDRARQEKLWELDSYDSSENVNSFTIGGQTMWLNVEERQQIATQISANEAVGIEQMTRWFGGNSFTFPLTTWKQMLTALELYAGDALNVTEGHRAAINSLESIEDINEYDFTTGYPEKLVFG